MTMLIKNILLNILKEATEDAEIPEEFTEETAEKMAEEDAPEDTSEDASEIQKENDELVDNAMGGHLEPTIKPENKELKALIITNLVNSANLIGINSDLILSESLETKLHEAAITLEKLIVNFRKTHTDSLALAPENYLSGEELIKNIEASLLRCRLYFYTALNTYQKTCGSHSSGSGVGPKVEFPTRKIFAKLLHPSEKDLVDIYDMYLVLPKETQNIILSKNDMLSKFVLDGLAIVNKLNIKSGIRESIIDPFDAEGISISKQREAERRRRKQELIDRLTLQHAKTPEEAEAEARKASKKIGQAIPGISDLTQRQGRIGQETAKKQELERLEREKIEKKQKDKNIEVDTPSTYTGDTASILGESINYIFKSYINGFLKEYVLATSNNIETIDKRIYFRLSNPYTVVKYFKGRSLRSYEITTGEKIEKRKNEAAKAQLQLFRDRMLSDEDILDTNLDPTGESGQESIEAEAEVAAQGSSNRELSDTDKIVFSSTNLLQEYFASVNYASCVGRMLETWASDSSKFQVKIFDKKEYKFINTNLISYLYSKSQNYLPTRGTKISDLQIDVLSCARYVITFTGEAISVDEETLIRLKREFLQIIKLYNLTEFQFTTTDTDRASKEAVRKSLNLSDIPAFSIPKVSTSGIDTFKEKVIERIKNPTTEYPEQVKEKMIERLEKMTNIDDILNAAKKIFGNIIVGQLLRNSSDKLQYSDKNQAEITTISKKVVKAIEYLMKPDPINIKDRTKYLFIDPLKLSKEELLKYLQTMNMATYENFIGNISKDPTFEVLQKNKEILINLLNDLKTAKQNNLTEDVNYQDQPQETQTNSEILQDKVIDDFLKSLIIHLQDIGLELHKLGNFLINLSKYPKVYLPEIESEKKFRIALRFGILRRERIDEILAEYEQNKDIKNEFSPLDNQAFRNTYGFMQDWIYQHYAENQYKDKKTAFRKAFNKAEGENEWLDLRTLLHDNWPEIETSLGNKQRIGNLIRSIIFNNEKWTTNKKAEVFKSAKITPEEDSANKEALSKSYGAFFGDIW